MMCILCFQAKEKEVRGTRFVITGLKTGGLYRFRVMAFNAAGNSEPGEVPEVLEVKDRTGELPRPPHYLITLLFFLLQLQSNSLRHKTTNLRQLYNICNGYGYNLSHCNGDYENASEHR